LFSVHKENKNRELLWGKDIIVVSTRILSPHQ